MRRLWWSLGQLDTAWPLALAVCLLALTAFVHLVSVPSLRTRLTSHEARLVQPAAPATRAQRVSLPGGDKAADLQQFYLQFNTGDSLPSQLDKLYRVAQAQGIVLRQGEYRLIAGRDSHLREYQVTLPVRGPYPKLRRFVAAALDALPVAALDQVAFERRSIGDAAVDAQVRLTLFLPEQ